MRKLACIALPLAVAACGGESAPPPPADPCTTIDAAPHAAEAFARTLACLTALQSPSDEARDAAVDALVAKADAEEGFPIVHGDQVTFVYVAALRYDPLDDNKGGEAFEESRRHGPVRVFGAFNAWDRASALVMEEAPGRFFHLTVPLADVAGRGYRLAAKDLGDYDIVFSDPLSRRFEYDRDGRRSLIRGDAEHGHLAWVPELPAAGLNHPRPLYVWVPPGYDQSQERYPVLYMHDGNNVFDRFQVRSSPGGTWDADQVMETQLAEGHVRPGIIVGVPNSVDRFEEYTHVPDRYSGTTRGGDGDDYVAFLVDECKAAVDARFRTLPDKAHTGVLGSSLGGLISFHAGDLRPDVFGFVGGMSSTFGWGRFGLEGPTVLERYAARGDLAARGQRFYLDSGGGPAPLCPGQEDNYCVTLEMRDLLEAKGLTRAPDPDASPLPADAELLWYWSEGAAHNEPNWNMRLHRALRMFFSPAS
jgi:hypothetical protein